MQQLGSDIAAMASSSSDRQPKKRRESVSRQSDMDSQQSKKARLLAKLQSIPSCSKTALIDILQSLHSAGALAGDLGAGTRSTVRDRVRQPLDDLRHLETPYGQLVKRWKLGLPALSHVDIINPFAYLYHLSIVSDEFAQLLFEASEGGNKELRVIMYIDGVSPGNPLRPDKARTVDCVYWTIAELPDHVVKSIAGWLLFSTCRTTLIETIPGAHSAWMKMTIRGFFTKQPGRPDFGDWCVHQVS